MKSVYNFRSFAEHRTPEGKILKQGYLYRSGDLDKIKGRDLLLFNSLGIKTVIDLRTKDEYRGQNSELLKVNKFSIPIDFARITRERLKKILHRRNAEDKIISALSSIYDEVPNFFSGSLQDIFQILSDEAAYPVLIHCRAGKDRTGFLSALILLAIGIESETVIEDYMTSNAHILPVVEKNFKIFHFLSFGLFPLHNIMTALKVQKQFIEKTFRIMEEEYGGALGYLKYCQVEPRTIEQIKGILLE